jgi:hypothetical protein
MTGTLTCQNGSHEPAMLSDSDIVSNAKSTGASAPSLSDAELTAVSGGWFYWPWQTHTPGGGFPIGRIYKPV